MATVVLNLAYIALVSSTMFRTVLWLRALLITGAIGFVVYGSIEGITSMVVWNIIIGALHSRQLFLHVRGRRTITLTPEDEASRQRFFPELSTFDFSSLWSMGIDDTYEDVQLTETGTQQRAVYLVLEGVVEVRRAATLVATIGAGSMVGEVSFLSGGPATADAIAIGTVRVREWEQSRLDTIDQLNPTAAKALRSFIGRDVAAKLA